MEVAGSDRLSDGQDRQGDMPGRRGPRPARSDEAQVWLRLLGGFEVVVGGAEVDLGYGVGARMVKLVALNGPLPAEEVIEALWPDTPAAVGRSRLASTLSRLRRPAGAEIVVRRRDQLVLGEGVESDLGNFLAASAEALAARRAEDPRADEIAGRALSFYGGMLLPADRYADWATISRELVRVRYVALLDLLAVGAASRGDVAEAVARLEQAIEADPHDEQRYLAACCLLAERGWRTRALAMVARSRAMLAGLGMSASAELEALDNRLRS